jgi:hypothetical protein
VATGEHLWREVDALFARVAAAAPEGQHAVVQLELGDERTIEPRALEVRGEFLLCDISADQPEIVLLRQADVRRIRIYAEERKLPLGFSVGEIELPPAS